MLNDDPIVDGFCYAGRLMDNWYVYQAGCVVGMDTLRRAKNYVPRIYAIPDITGPPTANFSNFTGQIRVVDGSFIWAISAACYINDNIGPPFVFDTVFPRSVAAGAVSNGQDFFFSVVDAGSSIPIFNDWISASNLFMPCETLHTNQPAYSILNPMPLSTPRPILAPGILTINISANGSFATASVVPQIILYCAEPCPAGTNKFKGGLCA